MKNRVFMLMAFALTLAIPASSAHNPPHRSAATMSDAVMCCGDPICPPPPVQCQP